MACHLSFSERRAEAVKGRCDGSREEHSSIRHRSHRADKTQGGKRQPKRERKTMERGRERVRGASLTVQVLFLGAHDLVGRGLAYCLRYRGASDTVLGRGDSVRQALARHLCGSSATPSAPQPAGTGTPKRPRVPTPHRTPYPHRLPARLPAWGGAQGRARPPARRAPARVFPTGSHTKSGHSRAPRLSLSPPLPWSAGARPGKRDRQLQENGGARLLLGAFRAAPVSRDSGSAPCSLPPAPSPFPSLSSPARPPPSLRRGKSGAAPARYVVEPARRAQQEARPRGRRGPPRHVTLPANRSPEAGPRVS